MGIIDSDNEKTGVPLSAPFSFVRRPHVLLVVLLLVCVALRLWPLRFDYFHPDEIIATEVARHVVETGALDTNWKNAPLPESFKYPQYNFSGYILSAAAIDAIAKVWEGPGRDTLAALRAWSAVLSVLATALTFFVGRALFGTAAGWVGALLVTINPLLVQDALYARPEAFVTALTLIVILGGPARNFLAYAFLSALAVGLLVATKISMISLAPLLFLPQHIASSGEGFGRDLRAYLTQALREAAPRALATVPGVIIGFTVGVPFALTNSAEFFWGIEYLLRQYAPTGWPNGLGEASTPARLAYVLTYFAATAGAPFLLLSAAGGLWAAADRNFRALAIFVCMAIFAARFATYAMFFERNLSHLMPIVAIFAAYGLVRLTQTWAARAKMAAALFAVLLALAAAPALRTTFILLAEEVSGKSRGEILHLQGRLASLYGRPTVQVTPGENYDMFADDGFSYCEPWLLEAVHYHSARSDAALSKVVAAAGFSEVGRYVTKFAYVPASSLHTYMMPTLVYLYRAADPARCAAGR